MQCFDGLSQCRWVLPPAQDAIVANEGGQITIIPKPELRGFFGDSHTKPPFKVTSAEVAIICPDEGLGWDPRA